MMRHLIVLSIAAALAGCGTLSRPDAPAVIKLHIEGGGAEPAPGPDTGLGIAVAEPVALPGFATRRIAYVERDFELRYYGRHEWAAPPAEMLQPAVVRALDASGRFATVVSPPSVVTTDLRLDLKLVRLVHDYRDGGELRLTVRAQLTSLGDRAARATTTLDYREPAERGPLAAAAAADRALARLLEDLTAFCAEHALD